MHVHHIGTISSPPLSISDVFHASQLSKNFLSIGQICELGFNVLFFSFGCGVHDPQTGQTIGTCRRVGQLFKLSSFHLTNHALSPATPLSTPPSSLQLWHSRPGHPFLSWVKILVFKGLLGLMSFETFRFNCTSFELGKQPVIPFNNSESYASTPFDLVHFNVWGPYLVPSMRGSHYFFIFQYYFSWYTYMDLSYEI